MKKTISFLVSVFLVVNISFSTNVCTYAKPQVYSETETLSSKISLTGASVTGLASRAYTGKKITPTVKVVHSGKTLTNRKDYYVNYSNNIKIGTAKVKITGKGKYKGTLNKTFKIIPKATSVTKLSKTDKTIKVEWKKTPSLSSAYQVQFCVNKNFENPKRVTVYSKTASSRTIKGLNEKTKYFIRVRSYKTVNSKKYYSKWSSSKSVTTYSSKYYRNLNKEVTFVAVGDNLIHQELIESGVQPDGTRDYRAFYANTKKYIKEADIASINQETILGGDIAPLSGFPKFNSPQEIADAVSDTGFDIMTLATNHCMDVGIEGINSALNFLKTKHPEIKILGLYQSEEENKTITYIEKNGIKIAVLNYTYRPETSRNPARPENMPWLFTNLNERDRIERDVKEAKKHSDIIIAYPHWGQEYNMTVTSYMKKCTKMFSELGVDIVIGTHPHVIAPVEWVTNSQTGKKMLVYYSLGNYVSFQDTATKKMLEGMAQFTLKKKDGKVSIVNPKLMPMVNYLTRREGEERLFDITVYPLKNYTEEMAKKHLQSELAERKKFVDLFEKTVAEEFRGEY
ncbi:MAG: CapA family protein [Eubacterium sp.]|nr:CapA family protein [Eubacterium sp.]